MATKEFDKNFAHLIEDALHNTLEYTGYSLDIDCIYIYISLERSVQYLVFFRMVMRSLRKYEQAFKMMGERFPLV